MNVNPMKYLRLTHKFNLRTFFATERSQKYQARL